MTRFGYVVLTYFTVMGVAAAAIVPTSLKLVWNVSASAPIGLYRIEPAVHLDVPDLVAVMPPERIRTLPFGTGLVLLRSTRPIVTTLRAWTRR